MTCFCFCFFRYSLSRVNNKNEASFLLLLLLLLLLLRCCLYCIARKSHFLLNTSASTKLNKAKLVFGGLFSCLVSVYCLKSTSKKIKIKQTKTYLLEFFFQLVFFFPVGYWSCRLGRTIYITNQ